MKSILRISICAVLLVAGLCGCEKIDVNKLEGSLKITFDGYGNYQVQTYDALSGKSDFFSGGYILNDECFQEKNTITFNPYMSDFTNVTYIIVKLTSNEMAWQKIGTAPNPGTWASDYRHFVRIK